MNNKIDFKLREVYADDFEKIFPLFRELWDNMELSKEKSYEYFSQKIFLKEKKGICAETDGKIIGYVALIKNGKIGYVNELIVDPAYRMMGVGESLMNAILRLGLNLGCKKIELYSGNHRKEAIRLYKKLGFKEYDINYYSKDI